MASAVKPTTEFLSGDKLFQKRARSAFPLLVRQATQAHNPTMFYSKFLSEAKTVGATQESRASSFGSGGESPERKRLKHFLAKHPEIVGLPPAVRPGNTEEPLKSGDVLDVFFRYGQDHIAVEVKS